MTNRRYNGRGRKHDIITLPLGDNFVEIDEKIADLISNCWQLGLVTYNSCQDNVNDMVWIEFELESAKKFIHFVCVYSNLTKNICKACDNIEYPWWDFDCHVAPDNKNAYFNSHIKPDKLFFTMSVRFPIVHQEQVEKAIRQAKNEIKKQSP